MTRNMNLDMKQGMAMDTDDIKVTDRSERDTKDATILKALSEHILRDCYNNPHANCLVYELDRFIESMEMYE